MAKTLASFQTERERLCKAYDDGLMSAVEFKIESQLLAGEEQVFLECRWNSIMRHSFDCTNEVDDDFYELYMKVKRNAPS